MLVQRVLTAVPLAALIVWVILFQPTRTFDYLLFGIIVIAAAEWARLSGVRAIALRLGFVVPVVAVSWWLMTSGQSFAGGFLVIACVWWLLVTFYLTGAKPAASITGVSPLKLAMALLVIPAASVAMHRTHQLENGQWWLMYALALVWVADIGAYFSGKRFGRKKLLPAISPGKTREGLYGALIATTLYSLAAALGAGLVLPLTVLLLLLSVALTIVSVSGDLFISLLKREAGLKDSGAILPGHGGMLDRIDSVLAAMPVFAVGYHYLIAAGVT